LNGALRPTPQHKNFASVFVIKMYKYFPDNYPIFLVRYSIFALFLLWPFDGLRTLLLAPLLDEALDLSRLICVYNLRLNLYLFIYYKFEAERNISINCFRRSVFTHLEILALSLFIRKVHFSNFCGKVSYSEAESCVILQIFF
jgi:hypothetical protein